MTRFRSSFVLAAVALAACATPAAPVPDIVGVWRLVELTDCAPDGTCEEPYGAAPVGRFVYTPGGRMSVQIMADPPAARVSGRDDAAGLAAAARRYIEYFGRYEADPETGVLIHHVEGAFIPNRLGAAYERGYAVDGDTLTITFEAGDGARYVRRLERVETFAVAAS